MQKDSSVYIRKLTGKQEKMKREKLGMFEGKKKRKKRRSLGGTGLEDLWASPFGHGKDDD